TGNVTTVIQALYQGGKFVKTANAEAPFGILLEKTNFYAEQGGQEYDTGSITIDGSADFAVDDVQVFGGYILHIGYLKYGSLSVGDEVVSTYDELRRWPIRNNHSATHILNFALKKTIGDGVDQKGSLVAEEKFRFDYSAKAAPSPAQLEQIEAITNDFIERNLKVYSKEVSLAVGKSITGLRAVFGEVYPDPVRVISVGFDIEEILKNPSDPKWAETSIEFCGGTHVSKTGDIKQFVVVDETSISKGIRRIVGVTGEEAFKLQKQADEHDKKLQELRKLEGSALEASIK
ncbi:Alanine--tRNA ligase, partial [Nowakowskiella sp. JEL0078]